MSYNFSAKALLTSCPSFSHPLLATVYHLILSAIPVSCTIPVFLYIDIIVDSENSTEERRYLFGNPNKYLEIPEFMMPQHQIIFPKKCLSKNETEHKPCGCADGEQ